MPRRGIGVGALRNKHDHDKHFQAMGLHVSDLQIAHIMKQLEKFRDSLQEFAVKHKADIKKEPTLRQSFQVMCSKIGIDPLVSKKGFWSELLDIGDFYYELSVQVIEVCIMTRSQNGGLIALSDVKRLLEKRRSHTSQMISEDDIRRAVYKVKVLGEGFQLIEMEEKSMIVTQPIELNMDHSTILALAQQTGGMVNLSILSRKLEWDENRSLVALKILLREGMAWIDEQVGLYP